MFSSTMGRVWWVLKNGPRTNSSSIIFIKQAFIDIRLRPGIATPIAVAARCSLHVSASRPLWPNVTSFIKPELHNVAQRRRRRIEPGPQVICIHKILCRSVQRFQRYARGQTDTQTDRQTDRNTPLPYRGGVKIGWSDMTEFRTHCAQFMPLRNMIKLCL